MKCSNCGRDNADFHNYCIQCGAALEQPAQARPAKRRMGLFQRLVIQTVLILIALAGLGYWLSTLNLVGAHAGDGGGGYAAYAVFVGRERLYAHEDGAFGFSESKVADTFSTKARRIAVRLDAFHYALGADAAKLKIVVEKTRDGSWPPQESIIDLPQNGCLFDRDIDLVAGRRLEPGRYEVRFYRVHDSRQTPLKSVHFTVKEDAGG